MPRLFDPLAVRGVTLRNRIGVSPMCQYSADNGHATDWHLAHLGARAVGGAGLVMVEATAVEDIGRITRGDMGLWADSHIEPLARVARFVSAHGAVPGVQIAHAGRKASRARPWDGEGPVPFDEGGWTPVAPSAVAFYDDGPLPRELTASDIGHLRASFTAAARRALAAGFRWLEVHAAHGYLLHEFLSPLSNRRTDEYGGSFDARVRLVVQTIADVRAVWPDTLPLAVRLSCTDWVDGGWTLEDSIALSKRLRTEGVDLIDCSSGGAVSGAKVPVGPGYQVPLAAAIKEQAGVATAAVGLITTPPQADEIISSNQADVVLIARASLRDPNWPLRAAEALNLPEARAVPLQYRRAY